MAQQPRGANAVPGLSTNYEDPIPQTTQAAQEPAPSRVAGLDTDYKPIHVTGSHNDLNFWPVALKWPTVTSMCLCYAVTIAAIIALYLVADHNPQNSFQLSSDNVHEISRYFPSIIGTINVLLFRWTIREFLRMQPYVHMADQPGNPMRGAVAYKSVGGAWFPWQSVMITPGFLSFFALFCQVFASFIVSLKTALFASTQVINLVDGKRVAVWILTPRFWPSFFLVLGHLLMIFFTLLTAFLLRGKSTGLKWDPVSIADYVALFRIFSRCSALPSFAGLELEHDSPPKKAMDSTALFRLGYWEKKMLPNADGETTERTYGIGVINAGADDSRTSSASSAQTSVKRMPTPAEAGDGERARPCPCGKWPKCEHYPYRQNPGCAKWVIILGIVGSISALGASIYALARGYPQKNPSFWLKNDLKIPASVGFDIGGKEYHLPPIDPGDPKSTLLVWALLFRSLPTYVAGLFTATVIEWVDLNMRFMQPFRNMRGMSDDKLADFSEGWHRTKKGKSAVERRPAEADDSILLSYITVAPLQVPLTAWDRGDYKVCIYSTLNTLSPLFPIFVGALLVPTPANDGKRVNFQFSLSAYIGVMVFLLLYSILLIGAFPPPYRRLPRQFYSLADLMAMCHQAHFLDNPDFDIHDRARTPSKQHMEARIRLTGSKYLFGTYKGRDDRWHMGFDVAQQRRGRDFGALHPPLETVRRITPWGWSDRAERAQTLVQTLVRRAQTFLAEEGLVQSAIKTLTATARSWTNPRNVSVRTHFTGLRPSDDPAAAAAAEEEMEMLEMYDGPAVMSGAVREPAASASGAQAGPLATATTASRVRLLSPTVEGDEASSFGSRERNPGREVRVGYE